MNLIPYLTGENENEPHEAIYIRKFDQNRHAVRNEDLKLVYQNDYTNKKLFDLSTNISESDTKNLYWNTDFLDRRDQLDTMRVRWEEGLIHPRFLGLIHDELVWATSVSLSETSLDVNLIEPKQITATILPQDAFNDVIEWSSNNPSVATVDQNGTVTAHAMGYAVITARVVDRRQVFEQCIVKVGNPLGATGITLSDTEITVLHGRTVQLTATVSENNDSYAVEWSSSNTSVATVDENGYVLTHSLGSAVITAKVIGSEQISATCTVLVSNIITSISKEKNQIENQDKISVFPNPVNGVLNIEFQGSSDKRDMRIYNSTGKMIYSSPVYQNINKIQLDLPGELKNGLYFIRLDQADQLLAKPFVLLR